MRLFLAAALLAALPMTAAAEEDSPQTIAVEARQGFYQMLGVNMGTLAGMAKGDVTYDEAAAVRAATNIEALTRYDLPMHFIDGTSADDMKGETAAKPDIWLDKEDFGKKYADLQAAATGLPDQVKGGPEQVGAAVQKLGAACKACHDTYRLK